MKDLDLAARFLGNGLDLRVDLRKRRIPIDFGLARAEHVEVRAVKDE